MRFLVGSSGLARSAASAAVLIWSGTWVTSGQTGADFGYAVMIEALCRQYAAAVRGMPADLMFDQCMIERHCRASSGSSGYQCEMPGPMNWHGGGY
jgi:hypothetical protein